MSRPTGSTINFKLDDCRSLSSSRPFHVRVSDDILAHIILFLSINDGYKKTESRESRERNWDWDWITVRSVCRHWRDVINGTPRLWAYIYRYSNLKRTELFLRLSKNSSLTVDLSAIVNTFESVKDSNITDNLQVILAELHRISYLHIPMSTKWTNDFIPLLQQSAPRLRSIQIYRIGACYGSLPISFPETSSALNSVVLSNVEISPNISCLRGLSSLYLCFLPEKTLHLSDLILVLDGCPKLISLTIRAMNFADATQTQYKSLGLPLLQYLCIGVDDYSDVYPLLRSIDAPNLLSWEIYCQDDYPTRTEDIPKLEVLSSLLTSFCSSKRVEIRYRETVFNVEVNDIVPWKAHMLGLENLRTATLTMLFEASVNPNIIYTAARTFLRKQLEVADYVRLDSHREPISEKTWYHMLCGILSAREITIHFDFNMDNNCEALQALQGRSPPTSLGEHENVMVPCPKLEHLLLLCPDAGKQEQFYSTLEASMKQRYHNGSQVQKLSLKRCNRYEKDLQELRRWVGDLEFTMGYD